MWIIHGTDVGMLALFAAPGVIFLVIELLIVARTYAAGGCFVPIGIAAFLFFLMWAGYATADGWDRIGWVFLTALAGSALAGSLLGGGIGLVFRILRRRKEQRNHEADQTI